MRKAKREKSGFTLNPHFDLLLSPAQTRRTISPFGQQRRCEFAPLPQWQRLGVRGKHLNANVASARGPMRVNPIGNST